MNAIDGKNILANGKTTYMLFGLDYGKNKTVKDYQDNPALGQFRNVLKSISY